MSEINNINATETKDVYAAQTQNNFITPGEYKDASTDLSTKNNFGKLFAMGNGDDQVKLASYHEFDPNKAGNVFTIT